jgi:hypothetical protein
MDFGELSRAASSVEPGEGGLSDADRFPFLTAAQLNSGQFETRYLIPGVLAAAQPGGIFGAFKTLKTSLTADLLISLASGTPFLGHFTVPEPGRALFLSGESGLDALQSIARRICAARGLALETLDNFELCPKLPNLDSPDDLRALGRIVRDKKPACLAIDPAYLAIRGEDARNLFAMGALLRPLAELCNETGCAILIVHHCKRTRLTPGDPATLDDIAWSGFAEFSAQWLLLSRRRRFDPDTGHHELWFSAGGRAGHHSLCALDVDEGIPTDAAFVPSPGIASAPAVSSEAADAGKAGEGQPATNSVKSGEGRNSPSPIPMGEGRGEGRVSSSAPQGNGRIWKTSLRAAGDIRIQTEVESVEKAESRRQLRKRATLERHRQRIMQMLRETPAGETARCFREKLGLTTERTHVVIRTLIDDGLVDYADVFKRDRWEVGFKLSGGEKIPAGQRRKRFWCSKNRGLRKTGNVKKARLLS